jgi:hypothetical protein
MGKGFGVGGNVAKSSGALFVWTLIALGVTALFSVILSARRLWTCNGPTRTWKARRTAEVAGADQVLPATG